jgi:hypothetical protein
MSAEKHIPLEQLSDRDLLILAVSGVNTLNDSVQKQGERIGTLESWKDKAVGFLALLSIITSAAVAIIARLIN